MRRHAVYLLGFLTLAILLFFYTWQPASDAPMTGLQQHEYPQPHYPEPTGPTGAAIFEEQDTSSIDWDRYYTDPTYEVPPLLQDPPEGPPEDLSYDYAQLGLEAAGFEAQGFGPQAIVALAACGSASGAGAGAGDILRLTTNLGPPGAGLDCVTLDVAGVTLDCNGFSITGNAAADDGVQITAANNEVTNCTIANFTSGAGSDGILAFAAADGLVVSNTTLFNNSGSGLFISAVGDAVIRDSSFISNGDEGIIMASAGVENITVQRNLFANNTNEEIEVASSVTGIGYNYINNTFDDPTDTDFLFEFESQNNVLIQGNLFKRSAANFGDLVDATDLGFAENITVINNTWTGPYPGSINNALDLRNFNNVTIAHNIFLDDGDIGVNDGGNVTVYNNTLNDTIFVRGSAADSLQNVLIRNNTWFEDRDNSTLSDTAQSGFLARNYTVRDHANVTMQMFCTSCNDARFINNTFNNNGRIGFSGVGNYIRNNRWLTLGLQGITSAGIEASDTFFANQGFIADNVLANGNMLSIKASDDNIVIANNTIENSSGNGIFSVATNITIINNTLTNISGVGIKINNTNATVRNNTVVFGISQQNTTLNLGNATTPELNTSGVGVFMPGLFTDSQIRDNYISVLTNSPLNTVVGILSGNNLVINDIEFDGDLQRVNISGNTLEDLGFGMHLLNMTNSNISSNTITNSTLKGLVVENSTNNIINLNTITAASPIASPSLYEKGLELYRSANNTASYNTVSGYHNGLFLFNGTGNNIRNISVGASGGYGVFVFQSVNNTIANVTASAVPIGVGFLQSDGNLLVDSVITSSSIGIELYQSDSNLINRNTQAGGGTTTYGLVLDLFSSTNTVNSNTFGGNTITDILYDMFASANTGVLNVPPPSFTSENGAAGNAIA